MIGERSSIRNRVVLTFVAAGALLAASGSAAQDAAAIAGIWLPDAARSDRFPADPPFTTAGRSAVEQWRRNRDPLEDDPGRFCQAPGMPSLALSGAGYPTEIVVTAQQVLILTEVHQQVRRVFLDTLHPERPFPQRNGHSVGYWDGETLVVDTVGIRAISFGAVPHSDQVRVIERYRTTDAGNTLIDEVTITDPIMYREPIVVRRYFTAAPAGTRMLEYECTEGMWIEHQESRGLAPFTE